VFEIIESLAVFDFLLIMQKKKEVDSYQEILNDLLV